MNGLDRVRGLVRDRPALRPAFDQAWRRLHGADPARLAGWAAATLELST